MAVKEDGKEDGKEDPGPEELLTPTQLGEVVHVNHQTIRRLIHEGRIKCVVIDGRYRIRWRDWETFLEENTR